MSHQVISCLIAIIATGSARSTVAQALPGSTPPSPRTATLLSVAGTTLPIIAGAILWGRNNGSIEYYLAYRADGTTSRQPVACPAGQITRQCIEWSRGHAEHGTEILLMTSGALFGPAVGCIYGGLGGHGIGNGMLRTVTIGAGLVAAMGICGWDCNGHDGQAAGAMAVFVGATVATAAWTIHDIRSVGAAVEANNRKVTASTTVRPTFDPASGRAGIRVDIEW